MSRPIYKVWAKIEIEKIDESQSRYETVDELPLPIPLATFTSKREALRFAEQFDKDHCIDGGDK